MDITQAISATTVKAPVAEKNSASDDKNRDGSDLSIQGDVFSKLLQGAKTEDALRESGAAMPLLAEVSSNVAQSEQLDALLNVDALLGQTTQGGAATWLSHTPVVAADALSDLADLPAVTSDIDSLLAQTLHLDQRADASLRDGSHVWLQQNAGAAMAPALNILAGAQPHTATGQTIATVAAGVQVPIDASKSFFAAQEPVATATAAILEAGKVADTVSQMADAVQGKDAPNEGRFTLVGNWKLDDPQITPSVQLQRLMGQIEQWAVAGSGLQPKTTERAESSKTLLENAQWAANGQGSGMRLTENAVREAQQTQSANFEAEPQAPMEDMRFWLQGKQQRAELMLDRDGQPVRVQVMVNGNEAHVTFMSEQQQTRDILDASLAELREMLAQQGVNLLGVAVQTQAQSQSQNPNQQSSQGDNGGLQQGDEHHAQIAVPSQPSVAGGQARALDVYA